MEPSTVLLSTQLAADEVVALVLSVQLMRAMPTMPFYDLAERALAKIEGALPAPRVRELRRLLGRLLVGPPLVGAPGGGLGTVDPALLPAFERAFTARRRLKFAYTDRAGRGSAREVEPQALLVRSPLWYIVAWDPARGAPRSFRMDRIRRPRVDEEATFDLRRMGVLGSVCPDAKPVRGRARG